MSVDKLVDSTQLNADLTSVANAIRSKSGKSGSLSFPSEFVSEINGIDAVANENAFDDVIFIDYDGDLLYHYSATEFNALTEMPANPAHAGLTAQGWNWTLADAKQYVNSYGGLTIGQNYITSDGVNRFYFDIPAESLNIAISYGQTIARGVSVDWGDGNIEATDGTGTVEVSHTYSSPGSYCISLDQTSGVLSFPGFFQKKVKPIDKFRLKEINFGNCVINNSTYVFYREVGLEKVSIPIGLNMNHIGFGYTALKGFVYPSGATNIGGGYWVVQGCSYLDFISVPNSITNININLSQVNLLRFEAPPLATNVSKSPVGNRTVRYTFSDSVTTNIANYQMKVRLRALKIPSNTTSLVQNYAADCYSIREPIYVPSGVTTVNARAFGDVYTDIHFASTTPPTLSNTNAFTASDMLIIYVPYSADHSILEAYKTATNWSTFASYMQEEPQS